MNKLGQSIVEYLLIVVLVVLGIVVMGPYVLHSIDAHFKLWDESTQDSFSENITQAPISHLPPINPNCNCTTTPTTCGTPQQCGTNYRIMVHSCPPPSIQGCDGLPPTFCSGAPDPSCCQYTYYGCGAAPIPPQFTRTDNTGASISPINLMPPPLVTGAPNCYTGQWTFQSSCYAYTCYDAPSALPANYAPWSGTPPSCFAQCTNPPYPPASAIPCYAPPTAATCLSVNTPITYRNVKANCTAIADPLVTDASGCSHPLKQCEYYCAPGYQKNSAGVCSNYFEVAYVPPYPAWSGAYVASKATITHSDPALFPSPTTICLPPPNPATPAITGLTVTDFGSTITTTGCGNSGNPGTNGLGPGQTCQVNLTW